MDKQWRKSWIQFLASGCCPNATGSRAKEPTATVPVRENAPGLRWISGICSPALLSRADEVIE